MRLLSRFIVAAIFAASLAFPGAATEIDLTVADTLTLQSANTGGPFYWYHFSPATGSGIGANDTFLELKQNQGGEQAFNTDDSGTLQFDKWTQSAEALPLADVPLVTISGVNYYELALGVNANDGYHSLDELQLFQSDSAVLDTFLETVPSLNTLPPVFDWFANNTQTTYGGPAGDIDGPAPADYAVLADNVGGQGNLDYLFYVPASAIDPSKAYLYLYVEMGYQGFAPTGCLVDTADCDADDGVDRWAIDRTTTPFAFCEGISGIDCAIVPEPGTVALLGAGLLGLAGWRRRRT